MTTSRKGEATMTTEALATWAEAIPRAQREAAARAAATATATERAHAARLEAFETGRDAFWLGLESGVRRAVRAYARGGGDGLQIVTADSEIALVAPGPGWSVVFRLRGGPDPALLVGRQSPRGREAWPPLDVVPTEQGALAIDWAGDALDPDELVRAVVEPLLQQLGAAR